MCVQSTSFKKGEKELLKAIEIERNPFKLKANNYFEITEKLEKFSNIIGSHSDEIAILPSLLMVLKMYLITLKLMVVMLLQLKMNFLAVILR